MKKRLILMILLFLLSGLVNILKPSWVFAQEFQPTCTPSVTPRPTFQPTCTPSPPTATPVPPTATPTIPVSGIMMVTSLGLGAGLILALIGFSLFVLPLERRR